MAKKVLNSDFIDKDFLKPVIERTKELVVQIDVLKESLKEIGKEAKTSFEGLSPAKNVKDSVKLSETLERLKVAQEQLMKLEESKLKATKQLNVLQEKQLKISLEVARSSQERLKIQQQELSTIKGLKDRNKELTKQLELVNTSTKEGIEQFKAIANEIEDNKAKIKGLTDEIKQERKQRELLELSIKAEKETLEGLIKTSQQAAEANKALRASVKLLNVETQGDRIAELNALIDQNSKLIEENADSQTQAKINIGRYTDSIKEALEQNEDFAKVSKTVTAIQLVLNKLFVKQEKQTEKNTERTKELTEANEDLADAAEKVDKSWKTNIIGAIIGAIGTLGAAFVSTSEGATSFQVVLAQINVAIQLFVKRAGAFALATVDSFKKIGLEVQLFGEKAKSALDIFGKTDNSKKIEELEKQILSLDKAIDENLARTTESFTDVLQENLKAVDELVRAEKQFEKDSQTLEKRLVSLRGEEEKLKALRDSDTLSFKERTKNGENLLKINTKIAQTEIDLASKQLEFAEKRIEIELRNQGIVGTTAKQIREISANEKLRKLVGDETLKAQTEGIILLTEKQNEYTATILDNIEQLGLVRTDILDRNLDDQIDYFDNVKAINERIIASDTTTLEQKLEANRIIREEGEKTFRKQIELLEAEKKAQIKSEIDILKATGGTKAQILAKEQELLNFKIDANKILSIQNAEEFNKELRNLEFSERAEIRVLEIFRERKTIKQDEVEINEDLLSQKYDELNVETDILELEKEAERIRVLQEKQAIIDAETNLEKKKALIEQYNKDIEEIEKETDKSILESEIKNLEKQIEERKKLEQGGSQKVLELEAELLTKRNELNKKGIDERKAQNDKDLEDIKKKAEKEAEIRQELLQDLGKLADEFFKKQSEKTIANLDKQLEEVQKRQDSLRDLANNGNEEAVKSLADSQKREAEIRREKEKELQRQKRIEAGLAAFQVLASKSKDNPKTALVDTIKDVTTLSAVINALPAFFDGTENIGKSLGKGVLNTQKDAYLANVEGFGQVRLDGSERIIPGYINRDLGDMTNKELHRMIKGENGNIIINQNDNSHLLKELIATTKKNNLKSFEQSFNSRTGVLSEVYKYQNKNIVQHKKLFGK